MEWSGANWFLGKLKHRKIELVSFDNPPFRGCSQIMSMADKGGKGDETNADNG